MLLTPSTSTLSSSVLAGRVIGPEIGSVDESECVSNLALSGVISPAYLSATCYSKPLKPNSLYFMVVLYSADRVNWRSYHRRQ